jgi:hypothetical protein
MGCSGAFGKLVDPHDAFFLSTNRLRHACTDVLPNSPNLAAAALCKRCSATLCFGVICREDHRHANAAHSLGLLGA